MSSPAGFERDRPPPEGEAVAGAGMGTSPYNKGHSAFLAKEQ